ncbi:hypothetical protein OE88DRAFT_1641150 [Heliocybe sulcata]|uniref:Uncharacterized protein n=1 Tax=Heliocybe sulcata TaxID=5364 RepID=A0A5C3NUT6_9AGAM|nr:hypothetical protein OE88DRAFT_1641150 [Heliocybe sulcata]
MKPATEPAFTLVLNNRDYCPTSRPYYTEIWYPPSPEPFSKDDPLMRTVDIRHLGSCSWASDLCVPAMSDIDEEERDGARLSEERQESIVARTRPKILALLEEAAKAREHAILAEVKSSRRPSILKSASIHGLCRTSFLVVWIFHCVVPLAKLAVYMLTQSHCSYHFD